MRLLSGCFWLLAYRTGSMATSRDVSMSHRPAGALLDPVADKMVIMTCAFVLAWNGWLPLWLAIPLIARDMLMLVVGVTDPRLKDRWLKPNLLGKVHSTLAFSTLTITIAQAAKFVDIGWGLTLLFVLLFCTVGGPGIFYFVTWQRARRGTQIDSSTS